MLGAAVGRCSLQVNLSSLHVSARLTPPPTPWPQVDTTFAGAEVAFEGVPMEKSWTRAVRVISPEGALLVCHESPGRRLQISSRILGAACPPACLAAGGLTAAWCRAASESPDASWALRWQKCRRLGGTAAGCKIANRYRRPPAPDECPCGWRSIPPPHVSGDMVTCALPAIQPLSVRVLSESGGTRRTQWFSQARIAS